MAERNLGRFRGKKNPEIFEIFFPKIAVNASNFMNHLIYMENSSIVTFFSSSLHNYWGGGGASPPAPPLATALCTH